MNQILPEKPISPVGPRRLVPRPALRLAGGRVGGWSLLSLAIALVLALPVVVVFGAVFIPAGEVWDHLSATVLPRYLENTFVLAGGVGVGTMIVGTGTAWLVTMYRFPGQRWLEWGLLLPMAVPAYVLAYTYTGMLDYAGPVQSALREVFGWGRRDYWFPEIRSLGGAVAMLVLVLYPYVYLLARAAFLEQSVCVLEASRTLGCSRWQSFWRVAVPLARPAIATGVALALMEALADFGTVQYFAVDTFTTGIYRTWLGLGDPAAAAQLAAMLMAFVFMLVLLERSSRRGARFHHTTSRYRPLPRITLSRWAGILAMTACFLPPFLGLFLPGSQLILWLMETYATHIDREFLSLAWNSVSLAAITAALAVAFALILAYGVRLRPSIIGRFANRLASMGYAIPGSVIAVGVLVPFSWADNMLDDWARDQFGISTGLLLSGTLVALVFAYLVRFLAVSLNTVEASMAKVTPNMDAAGRSLGKSALQVVLQVHSPIMRGSLLTAALLVFVDVLKELPATLIMRPFNFNTLAVRAFELASDEQLRESAAASLTIIGVAILPVILLSLSIAHSRPGKSQDRSRGELKQQAGHEAS